MPRRKSSVAELLKNYDAHVNLRLGSPAMGAVLRAIALVFYSGNMSALVRDALRFYCKEKYGIDIDDFARKLARGEITTEQVFWSVINALQAKTAKEKTNILRKLLGLGGGGRSG